MKLYRHVTQHRHECVYVFLGEVYTGLENLGMKTRPHFSAHPTPHLGVEGVAGIWSPAGLLGAHPIALDGGVMYRAHSQGPPLWTPADSGDRDWMDPPLTVAAALPATSGSGDSSLGDQRGEWRTERVFCGEG